MMATLLDVNTLDLSVGDQTSGYCDCQTTSEAPGLGSVSTKQGQDGKVTLLGTSVEMNTFQMQKAARLYPVPAEVFLRNLYKNPLLSFSNLSSKSSKGSIY